MGHAVSEAAARSVRKSQAAKAVERSGEQILKDIRSSLAAKLAVTPVDTAWLLGQYDEAAQASDAYNALKAQFDALTTEYDTLLRKNEEFRDVYAQENRSTVVTLSPSGVNELVSES